MSVSPYADNCRKSILCIGGANIDYCGAPSSKLAAGQSARGTISRSFGGVALNVAKGIRAIVNILVTGAFADTLAAHSASIPYHSLSVDIALWSVVGNDSAGRDILSYLTDANIDGSQALVSDEHPTGHYMCIQNAEGETHSAVSDIRAVESITVRQTRTLVATISTYDAIFIDCNLLEPILREIIPQVTSAKVFCDPVSPQKSQRIHGMLRHLYYFAPNIDEALCVTKTASAQDAISYLLSAGVTVPIITAGRDGIWYANQGIAQQYAIKPLALKTDCGLGDWFNAAMMVGDTLGIPTASCIDFAHRVVVHTITNRIHSPTPATPVLQPHQSH